MGTKEQYIEALGITIWQTKASQSKMESNATTLATLQETVASCKLCGLHKSRNQTVFGAGDNKANIIFIGEAPGANEDLQGKPFVGKAGLLLTEMLRAIGCAREKIYITNILKCRPPQNRDPLPMEVDLCTNYLQRQLEIIQPKLIVAVGRIAAHFLLKTGETMGRLRGKIHSYNNQIPLIVTYHPAYLLRSPGEKRKVYEDLLLIKPYLTTAENSSSS